MAKKTTQTTADENSAVVENKVTTEEAKTVVEETAEKAVEEVTTEEAKTVVEETAENAVEEVTAEAEVKAEKKVEVKEAPVSFELEGKKYQFSASAPKKIRVNNQSLTQEQIAKDSDLLIMLIGTPLIVKK